MQSQDSGIERSIESGKGDGGGVKVTITSKKEARGGGGVTKAQAQ